MDILCGDVWFLGCHANRGKRQIVSRLAGVANHGWETVVRAVRMWSSRMAKTSQSETPILGQEGF